MAQQTINVGTAPNDGTGTPLRTAFQYTNSNFSELYTAVGPSGNNIVVPGNATITGDLTVDTNTLKVDSANDRVGVGTTTPSQKLEVSTASSDTRVRINSTSVVCTEYFRSGTGLWLVGSDSTNAFKIARGSNFGGSADYFSIAAATADATWFDSAGGTRMTLNSTGLGVGTSPTAKLDVNGTVIIRDTFSLLMGFGNQQRILAGGGSDNTYLTFSQWTGASYTERMRIDPSGNVGIGVTPSAWASGNKFIDINSSAAFGAFGSSDAMMIGNAYWNGSSWIRKTANNAWRFVIESVSSTPTMTWQLAANGSAGSSITWTQAMTLDASGNLLVGTTSNPNSSRAAVKTASVTSALSLNSVTGDTAQELFVINKFDSNSTTSQVFARFTNNNGAAGSGQINGNGANACAFGSFSDARLKENIVSLPSQLANILSLRPVEFDYKDGSGHQIGFVAQEIQEVYADTVAEQNGFLTVTGWSKTEARLVSAIKELAAKVQALEAKLA